MSDIKRSFMSALKINDLGFKQLPKKYSFDSIKANKSKSQQEKQKKEITVTFSTLDGIYVPLPLNQQ